MEDIGVDSNWCSIENDGNGNNSGHVRIFENNGGTWQQIGQDIDGEAF